MDRFELDPLTRPDRLSRGKRSAFGVVVGLAGRTPLTLLDEVHLGMDVPSRYAFYDVLLADWLEHPRTIVLSSHLIGEVERLLEDVVVLDRGTVLTASDADTLRSGGVTVDRPRRGGLRVRRGSGGRRPPAAGAHRRRPPSSAPGPTTPARAGSTVWSSARSPCRTCSST